MSIGSSEKSAGCYKDSAISHYPPAKIPLTPPISLSGLGSDTPHTSSLLHIDHLCVSAGRAAITLALQHADIGKDDEVLVPAYHCESMIAPAEHVGAKPVYYRVHLNTHVDLDDLERHISPRSRAVLATHYFGFPQVMPELRDFCDKHGLILIEDCAHAFFGNHDGIRVGSLGDYAIGSAMKFFPLFDGGLLASARRDLSSVDLFDPPTTLELKGLITIVEYAMQYGRLKLISLPLKAAVFLKDLLWGTAKKALGKKLSTSLAPSSSQGGYALEPQWIHARMSRTSKFILTHSKINRICAGRRSNYRRVVDGLANTPGIKPLFAGLADGIVPLVVPMVVEDPVEVFPKLKTAGVPIWRFGEYLYPEIDEGVCANTIFLSKHVFQFPCHPELTGEEIDWMIDAIKQHLSS